MTQEEALKSHRDKERSQAQMFCSGSAYQVLTGLSAPGSFSY